MATPPPPEHAPGPEPVDPRVRIEAALAEIIDRPGSLVMAWHLVAAYRGPDDGDSELTRYWHVSPPGQPSYVDLGLMASATGYIQNLHDTDTS